jgi:pantetheine-phosphate adenylyltransferase
MAGMLRITGGSLARRRIEVPAAADRGLVRPSSDKLRAALFSALGTRVHGARVLDVCAGSGALAFEALSRGAVHATLIERDRKTAATAAANAKALGVGARCEVVVKDAEGALGALADFDLVLCDPPYALALSDELQRLLGGRIAPGGTLVLERRAGDGESFDPLINQGLFLERAKTYGDTCLMFFCRSEGSEGIEGQQPMAHVAIYPGSFDPLTNGHVDIIERGLRTFDRVIVAVANNVQKAHLFSIDERMALTRQALAHLSNVDVDTFDGLVVDYARQKGIGTLLRGLRAVSDFEYELQLASMNRRLQKDVETVFMMTSEELFYVSSKLVREVASFGGDISAFVPAPIAAALRAKLDPKKAHTDKRGG